MTARFVLAMDVGSNSVGSMWFDRCTGAIATGTSVFPAGVDETDDKRGDPKNAKRRMTRRTRITLRRRAQRKRELRLRLIECGLLPPDAAAFKSLLEGTDPWQLRREGLDKPLTPHQFGRVLLHLAQRRGALGLTITIEENEDGAVEATDDGKVKKAIGEMRLKMIATKARTFGEFISMERERRVHPVKGEDRRPEGRRKGPREYRDAVRNKAGNYEHCADRDMIRDEFARLWAAQRRLGGATATLLTDALRAELDGEQGDSDWRHKGLLFGQRRQTWDLGTLGRCVLEPTERCAPHADMYASRYLVVETINNLRIIERGKAPRPLSPVERATIKAFLSGPLGTLPAKTTKDKRGKDGKVIKGRTIPERPKSAVSASDLRELMGWGRATKTSQFRFNIEADEDREINTDWFSREIVHGAIGEVAWEAMPASLHDGINKALLRHDPEQEGDAAKLKAGVMKWASLTEQQAGRLVSAWTRRPKIDEKRLNMSRRAVRNLLAVMDRAEPWPDPRSPGSCRWLTQIEARKLLAGDGDFVDVVTGKPMDDITRRRYATGAKGATAADRHYMGKHVLMRHGKPVIGPDGHLSVRDGQLLILRKSEPPRALPAHPPNLAGSIPCEDLGILMVDQRDSTYSHSALAALAENGAAVVVCGRDHHPVGMFLPLSTNTQLLSRLDSQLNATKPTVKKLWSEIVAAKVRAQANVLPEGEGTAACRRSLLALSRSVRSGDPENIEAQAAALYWPVVFARSMGIQHPFRRRAGDRDAAPPNNLLDYGYAALRAAMARAIVSAGFLPALGIKHRGRSNPFCLADDLMEPLRPLVDRRVGLLAERGELDLSQPVKAELLRVLTDEVEVAGQCGPLMVAVVRYVASVLRVLAREQTRAEIPEVLRVGDGPPLSSNSRSASIPLAEPDWKD